MARLAVAIGDPAGIGPEVLVKALAALRGNGRKRGSGTDVLAIGDDAVWREAQQIAQIHLPAVPADHPGAMTPDGLPFLHLPVADRTWVLGEMSPAAGRAAAQWFEHAARLALQGQADAVVFAPLNKQAIIRAGYPVRDEYELCARLAGVDDHDEMNVIPHPADANELLWVARATGHAALRDVAGLLTVERVLRTIRLAHRVVSAAGTGAPRIGVAALNPHAGEGGLLGDEEARVIGPAIGAARGDGIDASGPHPADQVFRRARAGEFNVVVAMYHDQAQIATKLLGFDRGVSVGVGFPFVLATPSHGTAFDIAGKGVADHRPMLEALRLAQRLTGRGPKP